MSMEMVTAKWGVAILDHGFTNLPNMLIRCFRRLDPAIEHGEMSLLTTLFSYQHGPNAPHPSMKTLAENLGCSEKQIQKWVASLNKKGYLEIEQYAYEDGRWSTNHYNFKKLIDAVCAFYGEEELPAAKPLKARKNNRKPSEPQVPTAGGTSSTDGKEPQVPSVIGTSSTDKKEKSLKRKTEKEKEKKAQAPVGRSPYSKNLSKEQKQKAAQEEMSKINQGYEQARKEQEKKQKDTKTGLTPQEQERYQFLFNKLCFDIVNMTQEEKDDFYRLGERVTA